MVGDHIDSVAKTTDGNTHSQCASIDALISEQKDIRQLIEGLAKLLDQHQETSGTMSNDASAAMQLEITDLKTKVLRLTEQNTQQAGRLTFLASMSEQVNLIENQIINWCYRLPELTDGVVSAVEVQEDLDELKEVVLKKLKDLLTNLNALRVATPSACYRGPKPQPQKCPKWLGEGAKGVLDPGRKGLPRVFCTVQLSFAPVQEDFCTLGPKDLLHPLLTTLGTFEVSGRCSRHSGSQS